MEFDDLTPEQKVMLLYWQDLLLRPLTGQFARLLNSMKQIDLFQDGEISAILDSLSPTAIVPNNSGLAGTKALTAGNLKTFDSAYEQIEELYNTDVLRTVMIAIAGLENTGV